MNYLKKYKAWKQQRGFWQDAIYRFSCNKLAVVGLYVSVLIILLTIFGPMFTEYSYSDQDYEHIGVKPCLEFPMGTDDLGRDVMSRVIYGGRVSLSLGLLVQLISVAIGLPLGALAGFFGGKIDYVVTRLIDIMMAFPSLMLAIIIMVAVGPGYSNVLFSLVLITWPTIARIVRSQFLKYRETEFVTAARAIGAGNNRIVFRHILPNVMGSVIVAITLGIPTTIFREAGLSFLGIGVVAPVPSWGSMIGEYYIQIQSYWHISIFPALFLGLSILVFTFVGDGLQDALSPKVES